MSKLILIEGIPGSGKTTTARYVYDQLRTKGVEVIKYQEGDLHPCDLAWQAVVPSGVFDELRKEFPEYASILNQQSVKEGDKVIVAYTKLGLPPYEPLVEKLACYEVYGGKANLEKFRELHFSRWSKLEVLSDKVYIFECAFLQNHIVELMLTYMKSRDYIIDYLKDLYETVKKLCPTVIYLKPDNLTSSLGHVIAKRVNDNPKIPNWIDLVIDYLHNSPYGQKHEIHTVEDCITFFEQRRALELAVLDHIQGNVHILEYESCNWEQLSAMIDDVIKQL